MNKITNQYVFDSSISEVNEIGFIQINEKAYVSLLIDDEGEQRHDYTYKKTKSEN